MIYKKIKKRGLSSIVVTLILVLLGIAGIAIVWAVISNVITKSSKEVNVDAMFIKFDIIKAYESNGKIITEVQRLPGKGDIAGFNFVLDNGTKKEVVKIKLNSFEELDTKTFELTPKELSSSTITSVSIAPILIISGEERDSGVVDTYTITGDESGSYDGGSLPGGGSCIPTGKTEACGSYECGVVSDGCSGTYTCGTCPEGEVCSSDHTCIVSICEDNRTWEEICGVSNCGFVNNSCGESHPCGDLNGECQTNYLCNASNICEEIIPLNQGVVSDTWPGTSNLYFGSPDLPTDENADKTYINKFVKVNNTLEKSICRPIVIYKLPVEGYNYSHIGFNFNTNIQPEDHYFIFFTQTQCNVYSFDL